MDRVSVICKWAMKWYLMHICASWLWTASSHYAGGIWQRKIYSENASNVFRPTPHRRILKTQQYSVILDLCFGMAVFVKFRCQNVFRPRQNENSFLNYILRFVERFLKAPFSWRISVDGRTNRRNKATFSNFSRAVNAAWGNAKETHSGL